MRSGERPFYGYTPQRKGSSRLRSRVLGLGAVGATAAALAFVGPRLKAEVENVGANVVDGVERIVDNIHSDSLKGKPIEGREKGPYKTVNYDGGRPFPVRRDSDQSKQVGIALPSQMVEAQAVWGSSYEGYPGGMVEVDGQILGEWFEIDELQLVKENDKGEYVEAGVVNDVFVSGNFLTAAPVESDNTSDAQ